jgi:hypothetical protein
MLMRSFWLEHKQDIIFVLLVVLLFLELFFLLSYYVESIEQATSPVRQGRPSSTRSSALLTTALAS